LNYCFALIPGYFLQDQKADEAILKVLNMERFDSYLVRLFSTSCHYYALMCHNISSFAPETKLDEWVARATIFDSLTDTVSFIPVKLFLLETFYSLIPCDKLLSFQVRIAMVGKYNGLSDSYLSVLKVSMNIK
jgi:CTP synthase